MNVNGARLNHRFDFMNNKSHLLMYNCEMKKARRQYFSQIISDSSNNSKVLFNTIDRLINPPRLIPYELHTEEKCDQFATFFSENISTTRSSITSSFTNGFNPQSLSPPLPDSMVTFHNFTSIHLSELEGVVQK